MRDMLAEGTVGKLTTVNVDFNIGARFSGFRVEMDHPLPLDQSRAIHYRPVTPGINQLTKVQST
jgi:hypothetical protein